MRRLAPLLAACSLVVAACGDDGGEVSTASTTTTSTTGASTSTSGPSGSCALPGADTLAKSATGTEGIALLTDVRFGRQPCADRVVFDFRDGPPGYSIDYEPGPFTFGESGMPITIDGSAFLVVRLAPAAGHDLTQPDAPATYTGPAQIAPGGLAHVREIRRILDFEGEIMWVIGLDETRPFTAATLTDPARVYLDVG